MTEPVAGTDVVEPHTRTDALEAFYRLDECLDDKLEKLLAEIARLRAEVAELRSSIAHVVTLVDEIGAEDDDGLRGIKHHCYGALIAVEGSP